MQPALNSLWLTSLGQRPQRISYRPLSSGITALTASNSSVFVIALAAGVGGALRGPNPPAQQGIFSESATEALRKYPNELWYFLSKYPLVADHLSLGCVKSEANTLK